MAKLTPAQQAFLVDVNNGHFHCVENYRPAQRLVELGLCIWTATDRLAVTDAGRAILTAPSASAQGGDL